MPLTLSEKTSIVSRFKSLTQKELSAMLTRRHSSYYDKHDHWEFMLACYDGGREWFENHIFKYIKEGDEEYKERVSRAYRFNHTREVVDIVNKYIFKAGVHRRREDAPQPVVDFWQKSTLQARSIEEFMKLVSQKGSIFGKPWLVVDNNRPEGVVSVKEAKEKNYRVYAYIVPPTDVLDASFDEVGEINWIMLRERKRDDSDVITSSGTIEKRYRIWTRDYWVLFREAEEMQDNKPTPVYYYVDAGFHDLGFVPVVPADNVVDEDLMTASSLIDDVCYMDRAAANYLSNLDAIIQDQTFSQLIIPDQARLPGDDDKDDLAKLGTKRIFTYDGSAQGEPKYISPDPRQPNIILQVVNKIISEIYHSVGMAGERTKEDNAMGIDNSSGVAKAYDFERMNAMLAAKADALEFVENRIVKIVMAWSGNKNFEADPERPLVVYPKNFDVRSLYDEFEIAEKLALMAAPKKLRREQMKIVATKMLPTVSKETSESILAEIDKDWPEEIDPLTVKPNQPPQPKPTKENKSGQNQGD